jgi:hypothetical protein
VLFLSHLWLVLYRRTRSLSRSAFSVTPVASSISANTIFVAGTGSPCAGPPGITLTGTLVCDGSKCCPACSGGNVCVGNVCSCVPSSATIVCPLDVAGVADSSCSASLSLGSATATNNCGINVTPVASANGPFPVGATVVTWQVASLSGSCSQTVLVTRQFASCHHLSSEYQGEQ